MRCIAPWLVNHPPARTEYISTPKEIMKRIALTQNKFTLVDDEDFAVLNIYKWRYGAGGYAVRSAKVNGRERTVLMHRVINETQAGYVTDHINRDKLDNRRSNLRPCTQAENSRNSEPRIANKSGYKGVYWYQKLSKWQAQITYCGKRIHLGYFSDIDRAIDAHRRAASRYFKEYANG